MDKDHWLWALGRTLIGHLLPLRLAVHTGLGNTWPGYVMLVLDLTNAGHMDPTVPLSLDLPELGWLDWAGATLPPILRAL